MLYCNYVCEDIFRTVYLYSGRKPSQRSMASAVLRPQMKVPGRKRPAAYLGWALALCVLLIVSCLDWGLPTRLAPWSGEEFGEAAPSPDESLSSVTLSDAPAAPQRLPKLYPYLTHEERMRVESITAEVLNKFIKPWERANYRPLPVHPDTAGTAMAFLIPPHPPELVTAAREGFEQAIVQALGADWLHENREAAEKVFEGICAFHEQALLVRVTLATAPGGHDMLSFDHVSAEQVRVSENGYWIEYAEQQTRKPSHKLDAKLVVASAGLNSMRERFDHLITVEEADSP